MGTEGFLSEYAYLHVICKDTYSHTSVFPGLYFRALKCRTESGTHTGTEGRKILDPPIPTDWSVNFEGIFREKHQLRRSPVLLNVAPVISGAMLFGKTGLQSSH